MHPKLVMYMSSRKKVYLAVQLELLVVRYYDLHLMEQQVLCLVFYGPYVHMVLDRVIGAKIRALIYLYPSLALALAIILVLVLILIPGMVVVIVTATVMVMVVICNRRG
jgi:hypothetical protein